LFFIFCLPFKFWIKQAKTTAFAEKWPAQHITFRQSNRSM
jgi:hypothetical protein